MDAADLPDAARRDLEAARLGCAIDARLAVAGDAPSHRFPLLAERAFGAPIDIGEARATPDPRNAALHRRAHATMDRSEEDRLGKAGCRSVISRGTPAHTKKKT